VADSDRLRCDGGPSDDVLRAVCRAQSPAVSNATRRLDSKATTGDPQGGRVKLLHGWGRSPGVLATVVDVSSERDLERLIASRPARGLIARGEGHSYGDAAQRAGGLVAELTGLNRMVRFDPVAGTATVQAGMTLGGLMRAVVPSGWLPAVLPGTRFVTVGAAIATDVHGRNHHHDGSFADHVLGIRICTPSGIADVTPETSPELFWATAGGMGLTGVIVQATLALTRIETAQMRTLTHRARDLDQVLALMADEDRRYRYSAAWIDGLARGKALGRGVVVRGNHATRAEVADLSGRHGLRFSPTPSISAPRPMTHLTRHMSRMVNETVFRRSPAQRERYQSLHAFFHTHDRLDLFRLFAPEGCVEYHFVVPVGQADVVRKAIERMARAHHPPFISIIKRFGDENPGGLSFPMAGWMGVCDFTPAGDLPRLLDDLDELVAQAGGRTFLAKDARVRPDTLRAMYPKVEDWREIRGRLDPDGVMRSDLAERLALV
jgi:decaprenylphospho-beta-D-ribofuranose 2-oxidase